MNGGLKKPIEDMWLAFHTPDIIGCTVCTLAIRDWIDKPIGELSQRAQQVWLDKVNHAEI